MAPPQDHLEDWSPRTPGMRPLTGFFVILFVIAALLVFKGAHDARDWVQEGCRADSPEARRECQESSGRSVLAIGLALGTGSAIGIGVSRKR